MKAKMKKLLWMGIALFGTASLRAQSPCDSLPNIQLTISDITPCQGEAITLTASGGQTYSWNNGVLNGTPFTPVGSDTFQVVVTDTLGCIDSTSVAIEVLPLPNLVANASSLTICLGDSVLLNATNADSYTWINPTIDNNTYYTPTQSGTEVFVVEGTGTNGCMNTSQVIVVVNDLPELPTLNTTSISTCQEVQFEESITGTVAEGRIIWFNDAALTDIQGEQSTLDVGWSEVGVTNYWATSFLSGCYSEGVEVSVEVFDLPVVDAGFDIVVKPGETGNLDATVDNYTEARWVPSTQLDDPYSLTTEFQGLESTVYVLEVIDENNCFSSDDVFLQIDPNLIISNVVTPNGDGDNDVWKIYPQESLDYCRVRLYDGFGRTMIYEDGYRNTWDGTYEGKEVPDGDYYYHITCTGGYSTKGTLTLLR